jgi:hypothetical protein
MLTILQTTFPRLLVTTLLTLAIFGVFSEKAEAQTYDQRSCGSGYTLDQSGDRPLCQPPTTTGGAVLGRVQTPVPLETLNANTTQCSTGQSYSVAGYNGQRPTFGCRAAGGLQTGGVSGDATRDLTPRPPNCEGVLTALGSPFTCLWRTATNWLAAGLIWIAVTIMVYLDLVI